MCIIKCTWINYSFMDSLGSYQPQATTSQKMMKIFAFGSSLVELLAVGLQTYNRACYRQFVKRIGHIIRSAEYCISYLILCYTNFPDIFSPRVRTVRGEFAFPVLFCIVQDDSVLCEWSLGSVCQFNWSEQNHHAGTVILHGETAGGVWPSLSTCSLTCSQG